MKKNYVMEKFDKDIIINYEKREGNCSGWWDKKNEKPHNCFILGDKSTRINLGWFEFIGGEYFLTGRGEKHYKTWLKNNELSYEAGINI